MSAPASTPRPSRFGTSPIHVVKLIHRPGRHDLREVAVTLTTEAALESGDDQPTLDTMRATVYAVAKEHPLDQIEEFGLSLNDYLLMAHPRLQRLDVRLVEHPWRRLSISGLAQHHAFTRVGEDTCTARVIGSRGGTVVEAGVEHLLALRTSAPASDRSPSAGDAGEPPIFAATITASWRYSRTDISFGLAWQGVRQVLLETFVEYRGGSTQATLQAIGDAVLQSLDDVAELTLTLVTRPHWAVDLSAFGMTNVNEFFSPLDGPCEVVEATLSRS